MELRTIQWTGAWLCGLALAVSAPARTYHVYQPEITRGYMYPPGELLYNHDASIELFQGRFYGAWNGNTNRWEARPGQRNYWAVSDDGLSWSDAIVFDEVPKFGPPSWQTEWQPNLLNWKDEELWCFWTKAGGFIFSTLNEDRSGWNHRVVWESVELKGELYHTFPTQEATVLDDGAVLIPSVFRLPAGTEPEYDKRTYYSGPIITRDGGRTFYVPEAALVEHPEVEDSFKMWEPMYIVQDDGAVRMFNRTNTIGKTSCEMPDTALITAIGSADGEQMNPPYYSAIRTLHSRMWLGTVGSRRLMLHHDSMKNWFPRDRINIALFSSRTGRDDFVAGIPIEDGLIGIAYPQAVFVNHAAYVVYTHQNDPATIVVNRVYPLPAEDRWYLFPRSGNRALTSNDAPRPVPSTFNVGPSGGPVSTEAISSARWSAVLWLSLDESISGALLEYGRFKVTVDPTGYVRVTDGAHQGMYSRPLPADGRWMMLGIEYDAEHGLAALSVNATGREEWPMAREPVNSARVRWAPDAPGLRMGRAEVFPGVLLEQPVLAAVFNRQVWTYGLYPRPTDATPPSGTALAFCPAAPGSGFEPVAPERLEPGYVEFYAAVREVRAGPPNELGTRSVTVTGWVSKKPKSDGVLLNALSPDGRKGFSLRFNYNGNLHVTLGGENKGQDIMTPNPMRIAGLDEPEGWKYGPWFFFAIVLDNETGEVRFWNNGRSGRAREGFEPGMNWSTGETPAFARPMPQEVVRNHYPLYARVHRMQVYDRALSLEEITQDFRQEPDVRGASMKSRSSGGPVWVVSAEAYDESFDSAQARRPLATPVLTRDDDVLLLGGNAAAGVDLERFDPENHAVDVILPVRMELPPVSETVIFMTLGDENQIAVGLRREDPGRVYVRTGGVWHPATRFAVGQENRLRVRMDKSRIVVTNGEETVTVPNRGGISQRLYLGDGYPERYIAPSDRFQVHSQGFSARVLPTGASGQEKLP